MASGPNQQAPQPSLDRISSEAKNFFSAGSSFSAIACASAVQIAWSVSAIVLTDLKSPVWGLLLSFLIVFAYALVIPEPKGYPGAGKMKITVIEIIFGFFNAFIVFAIVLGLNNLPLPE